MAFYMGRKNVYCIIDKHGGESYLTKSITLAEDLLNLGAVALNTVEKDNKHVLFAFDSNDKELKRYYIGKHIQGKSPQWIKDNQNKLYTFESYNPKSANWIPCVGLYPTKIIYERNLFSQRIEKTAVKDYVSRLNFSEVNKRNEEEAEETVNKIYEYGTSDPKKIQEIKQKKKDDSHFWWIVIIAFIIGYMAIGGMMKCAGVKGDPVNSCSGSPEYRHTDRNY